DLGITRPDGVDVDPEPLPALGQKIGHKDVCGLDQLHEHLETVRVRDVECHAALSTIGLLDEVVDAPRPGHHAGVDQTALRVTRLRVLDLDHVGAPVCQDRPGGGDKSPGGQLDDLYSGQDLLSSSAHGAPHIGRYDGNPSKT